jgi:hypothetical protein
MSAMSAMSAMSNEVKGGEHKKAIQWLNKSAISLAVKRRFIGVFIAI